METPTPMVALDHSSEQGREGGAGARGGQRPAYVLWFEALSRGDVPVAGGKGANLGELTRAGLPVPRGFVITAAAFQKAMEPVRGQLSELWHRVDPDDADSLAEHSAALQALVRQVEIPGALRKLILRAYHELGEGRAVAG
ncbi:MAG: PEP/pyruvate-binding domain-containing protein, partial [Archangium sp.]